MTSNSDTVSESDRFELSNCTTTMKAVVTIDNGGDDKLNYRDVPIPVYPRYGLL